MEQSTEAHMYALNEMERRATDRFATKEDVEDIKRDLKALDSAFTAHKTEFSVLLAEFRAMKEVLERIFWAILTPLLGAAGFGAVWAIMRISSNGNV